MRKLILLIITTFIVLPSLWAKWEVSNLVDPFTVDSTRYVLDDLHYLSEEERQEIDSICAKFRQEELAQLSIVILDRIDDTPQEFALQLHNQWKTEDDNRKILLLLLMEQQKWQFISGLETGETFSEEILTQVGEKKLEPEFKKRNYYTCIRSTCNELYTIAHNPEYLEFLGYRTTPKETKTTLAEYLFFFWLFVILLPGIFISINANRHAGEEGNVGKQKIFRSKEDKIILNIESQGNDWGVWSNAGCLRYLLKDVCMLLFTLIAFIEEESLLFFAASILAYLTYIALLWGYRGYKKANNAPKRIDQFLRFRSLYGSHAAKAYKYLVPWVGLPLYYLFKRKAEKAQDFIKCPICKKKVELSEDVRYRAVTPAQLFELEKNIIQKRCAYCPNGHKMTVNMPDKNFTTYHFCPTCETHTARLISEDFIKIPTGEEKGKIKLTYKCSFCDKTFQETKELPKLIPYYNGSICSYGSNPTGKIPVR
ncbi:MAG: TPM domain-containing protein [Paludibacteraceae bacterium]|nr:TPM domain-containing protein [Paludibacteraceae bacterium]